ncbi:putative LRR receptor-like serine/threonine-protein kinase [Cinnamomum micranthum f. kanehirae]|uniref:Putative LRR receptor-like serine/threonine-protein kinase n=1 Tax=Cinnamomum micranthum f. kanehirae TaxID=337451 RepID=A0A443NI38_9MAGN|nr:putative LRR receptor-like serine/threonine-protein kinase [Cinnamomum micranthum f. kanehirae]
MLYENRRFTYAQVVSITNNFEKSIGRGGFGTVYHGQMTNGTQVAVKMLFLRSIKTPCQGSNELRMSLSLYVGLEYLHDDCKPAIIHRDVNTANILLNERLEAKIGDFGLSRDFNDEFTSCFNSSQGTFGYLDPEYCNSNNLTEKSDVYSFGVVLLQLITGKPAIVRITNSERISLIDWAIPMIVGGDIRDVIDPKFEGNYDMKSIQKVAEIAHSCTSQKSIDRPHMRDVVVELKEYIINEKALASAPGSGGCMNSGPVQTSSEIMSYLSASGRSAFAWTVEQIGGYKGQLQRAVNLKYGFPGCASDLRNCGRNALSRTEAASWSRLACWRSSRDALSRTNDRKLVPASVLAQ